VGEASFRAAFSVPLVMSAPRGLQHSQESRPYSRTTVRVLVQASRQTDRHRTSVRTASQQTDSSDSGNAWSAVNLRSSVPAGLLCRRTQSGSSDSTSLNFSGLLVLYDLYGYM
jgi:hypothetical protein